MEKCAYCGWEGLTAEITACGGYCPCCDRQEDLEEIIGENDE